MSDLIDLDGLSLDQLRKKARAAKRISVARERERCEDSLVEFMVTAWRHTGEAGEPIVNWHHREIARHLEALALRTPGWTDIGGPLQSLIANIPPRCTKTLLCNVMFPAWIWCQPEDRWGPLMGPQVRFLCVSYGATLSEEIAVKMRRLVMGDWYQGLWGDRVKLRDDQTNRANFGNTAGGERISTSVEGGILGRGGDIQLWDDPQNPQQAESEAERRMTIEALRNLATRVTDPRRAARILIAQRLHEQDATNYALEHWDRPIHLCYPMRYDSTRGRMVPSDPRAEDGELLWPEVWSNRLVSQEERELLDYNTAAQLQQSPVPRGGGIIKREWWRLWPDDADKEGGRTFRYRCGFCTWEGSASWAGSAMECQQCGMAAERVIEYPATSFRLLSVDTNYGSKEINSWSAATMWGVWHDADDAPRLMLMEAWRGRPKLRTGSMSDKGLVERIYDMAMRRNVDTVLIERKTRGQDLYDELDRLTREYPFRLEFFEPTGRGDKVARLNAVVPLFTNDLVWAPDKKWAELVISEVSNQPFDKFDDLADTCLIAGTIIATRRGPVPIESVRVGDLVMTPQGWKRVKEAGCTGIKPVLTAHGLTGTRNHPIFTLDGGFLPLGDIMSAAQTWRLTLCGSIRIILQMRWSTTAFHTGSPGPRNTTFRAASMCARSAQSRLKGFMSLFGRKPTVRLYPRAITSITGTETPSIAILRTWSAYRLRSIGVFLSGAIESATSRHSLRPAEKPPIGIGPTPAASGIEKTPYAQSRWHWPPKRNGLPQGHLARAFVSGAAMRLWEPTGASGSAALSVATGVCGFARGRGAADLMNLSHASGAGTNFCWLKNNANVDFAGLSAPISAPGIAKGKLDTSTPILLPVYNLSVEDAECYFANGVLVHNCSSALAWLRANGHLSLKHEHAKSAREALFFRGRSGRFDAGELYEGA